MYYSCVETNTAQCRLWPLHMWQRMYFKPRRAISGARIDNFGNMKCLQLRWIDHRRTSLSQFEAAPQHTYASLYKQPNSSHLRSSPPLPPTMQSSSPSQEEKFTRTDINDDSVGPPQKLQRQLKNRHIAMIRFVFTFTITYPNHTVALEVWSGLVCFINLLVNHTRWPSFLGLFVS